MVGEFSSRRDIIVYLKISLMFVLMFFLIRVYMLGLNQIFEIKKFKRSKNLTGNYFEILLML